MRHEFCTLFDRRYLARGLVLYQSLAAHCEDFRLHVFCMDEETQSTLDQLSLTKLVTVPRARLEADDPALASTRATRSRSEYYWTAAPAICKHVFDHDRDVELVTRLDVDL